MGRQWIWTAGRWNVERPHPSGGRQCWGDSFWGDDHGGESGSGSQSGAGQRWQGVCLGTQCVRAVGRWHGGIAESAGGGVAGKREMQWHRSGSFSQFGIGDGRQGVWMGWQWIWTVGRWGHGEPTGAGVVQWVECSSPERECWLGAQRGVGSGW